MLCTFSTLNDTFRITRNLLTFNRVTGTLPLSWPVICLASALWQEHTSIYSSPTSLNININTSSLHIRSQLPNLHRFVTQKSQKEQSRCWRQEGEEERVTERGTRRACSHERVPGRQPKLYFDIIVSR